MIRKILYLLSGRERRRLAGLVAGNVLISILDIASLGLLLYIVGFYTGQHPQRPPAFLPGWLMDRNSLALVGVFSLFFLIKSAFGYLHIQRQYRFVYQVASRLSETNMLHYLEGSYPDYVRVDASVHIRKIREQPIEFCQYVLTGYQQMLAEGMLVVLTVVAIILFNVKLFLLLALLLLPALAALAGVSRRRLKAVRGDIRKSGERSLQHLREALTGYVESNVYEKKTFFARRYAGYQRLLNRHLAELQIIQGIPSRFIEVFAVLGLFILIAFAHWSGDPGAGSFVALGAFLAAAYKIIPGMVKIVNLSGQVKTYQFTVDDLYEELLKTRCGGQDAGYAEGGADNGKQARDGRRVGNGKPVEKSAVKGLEVAFRGVSFSQPQGRIVRDLSFCLRPGELLGMSGSSGKGKTTIVNLLLGFLTPDEGEILIDSRPVTSRERQGYWSRIAYVKQQPFLLYDTVLKNITLTDDDPDKELLDEVLRVTGLQRLGGEETLTKMITENGKNISGGQRQRIAFARALYKDADLLILDEPFSELDDQAEWRMLEHCLRLAAAGKTILLITHNQKNLSLCHKTMLLDDN